MGNNIKSDLMLNNETSLYLKVNMCLSVWNEVKKKIEMNMIINS